MDANSCQSYTHVVLLINTTFIQLTTKQINTIFIQLTTKPFLAKTAVNDLELWEKLACIQKISPSIKFHCLRNS